MYDALNGHVLSASVVPSVGPSLRQLVRRYVSCCVSWGRSNKRASVLTSARLQAHASYTLAASVRAFLRLYCALVKRPE